MFDIRVLAENIKKYRKHKNITQTELAEKLMISPQSVSKWECGLCAPDIDNLCKISNILDVSLDILIGNPALEEKVMIAVDGGGSKTEFVLFTESGRFLGRTVLGGCNPNYTSLQTCCSILKHGIDSLLNITSKVSGIFIGASGFDCGNNAIIIEQELKNTYKNIKIQCETDSYNVMACSENSDNCIVAVCGSGSVVYVNRFNKLTRYGGWGYLLESGGSGFDIGRAALEVALKEREGVLKHSLITEYTEKKLGSGAWEALPTIYQKGQFFVADFANTVFKAFESGDKLAKKILENCAEQIADNITRAAKANPTIKTLIISGSTINSCNGYLKMIISKIPDWLKVDLPEYPSVFGACIMCCRLCDIDTKALYSNFLLQYSSLTAK